MKLARPLLFSLFIIAGLLLVACGGDTGTPTDAAPQPTQVPPDTDSSGDDGGTGAGLLPFGDFTLDPANATSDSVRELLGYMYEGLVRLDGDNVMGALAASYTVSEDGLDYIFNLRPGVTFHDGTALDADAVVANFHRWFDPQNPNRGSGEYAAWLAAFGGFKGDMTEEGLPLSSYDGIEKVNDFTVLVHLNTPDPEFLTKMADVAFAIVSPGAFNGEDGGSGPYRFGGISGSTLTLEPFPGYWDPSAVPDSAMELPLE
jgi:peptide/nickel transport system substrate-binding protein